MSAVAAAVRRKFPLQVSQKAAAGLLMHATFGTNYTQIAQVASGGRFAFENWVNAQLTAPAFDWWGMRTSFDAEEDATTNGFVPEERKASALLFYRAQLGMTNNDALRSRAAYCMLKFFPINFGVHPFAVSWLEAIEPHLFGTYRDLLEAASMNVPMARWLTFSLNRKATATNQPDENFAREIMQLFSIGLWELHPNGERIKSGKLDPSDPRYVPNGTDDVPTYDLEDVRGLARVFTGWKPNKVGDNRFIDEANTNSADARLPLVNDPAFHESGAKSFLGITIPENTDGPTSLALALDRIVSHPSCAPFVCKRMIQMLTTSNPSPEYVARVVSAWHTSAGGNLAAMWKAILLDQEARSPNRVNNDKWGKVREPWVIVTQASFPYNPTRLDGGVLNRWERAQANSLPAHTGSLQPLAPPSVFGFYPYDFSSTSELRSEGFYAPELSFLGDSLLPEIANRVALPVARGRIDDFNHPGSVLMDFQELTDLPTKEDVAERINLLYCAGSLSAGAISDCLSVLPSIYASDVPGGVERRDVVIQGLLRLMLSHPEALVQK